MSDKQFLSVNPQFRGVNFVLGLLCPVRLNVCLGVSWNFHKTSPASRRTVSVTQQRPNSGAERLKELLVHLEGNLSARA